MKPDLLLWARGSLPDVTKTSREKGQKKMPKFCSFFVLILVRNGKQSISVEPGHQGRRDILDQTACKTGSVPACAGDGHSSGAFVAERLARPTRTATRKCACPPRGAGRRPYLVLLPVGFAVPSPLPETRCALTAPFHPCRRAPAFWAEVRIGGLLSVALSLGSPPPDVIRHRISVEPGLSSPVRDKPGRRRPSGRLVRTHLGIGARPRQGPSGRFLPFGRDLL